MTNDTFSRDDLANHATDDEIADEVEAADEADEIEGSNEAAEPAAARASAPTASRRFEEDDDIELPTGADERMPDLSDPDINFDVDVLRTKTAGWVARRAESAVARVQSRKRLDEKVAAFAKSHPDFETVVAKNPVLAQNQLSPDAAVTVARSVHTGELLYRFGKDKELAIRVARMRPAQQVVAVANMIRDIEDEKRAVAKAHPQRQTPTRKGPLTREEQLSGRDSMQSFAAESRAKRFGGRFYGTR